VSFNRSEARAIWKNIADGILYRGLDENSLEHHEALEFLAEVAKGIVEADNEPNAKRRGSIVRAVKLSSKVTKNEYELRKAMEVVDDFNDKDIKQTPLVKSKINKAKVNYYRKIINESLDPLLRQAVFERTDADIQKDIDRLKSK
jgi:hypothetical protein